MRSHDIAEILEHNREPLRQLKRSLRISAGQFSVVLVRCDYQRLQQILIGDLQQRMDGVQEVRLTSDTAGVVSAIRHHLHQAETPPTALMVTQLWALPNLNQSLKDANLARDQLRDLLDCPLVFWLSDRVVRLVSRYAQDFKNQATPTIAFSYPPGELMCSLHRGANQIFRQVLDLGSDRFLPDSALDLQSGSQLRNELDAALRDVGDEISQDADLQASFRFLQGRDAHSRIEEMASAKAYYEQSLEHWVENSRLEIENSKLTPQSSVASIATLPTALEKAAVLHFHLGLWWRAHAVLQRTTYDSSLKQARRSFTACVTIFRELDQPQRTAQFIHALAEVLQKQRDWAALETIAQEAYKLHQQTDDLVRQARDRGFFAEIALKRQDWAKGQTEALLALQLLDTAQERLAQNPDNPSLKIGLAIAEQFQRGWYRYLQGEAQMQLGSPQAAIALLVEAKAQTSPEYDLTLYRQILDELIHHYFESGQYLNAFHIKQERRAVEFRYNLRAFIGAGAVQPHQRTAFAQPLDDQTQSAIAAEIAASGRELDIKRLTQRLRSPQNQLVVIHGPSGVGKSSIVNAGLTPALGRLTPEGRNTLPILVQTYVNWQQGIEAALDRVIEERSLARVQNAKLKIQNIALNPTPPLDAVKGNLPHSPTPRVPELVEGQALQTPLLQKLQALNDKDYFIVLLFDQFEEFFFEKQLLQERQVFYEFLSECLNRPELSFVKVVLSLREDYLHHLLEIEQVVDQGSSLKDQDILSREVRYPLGNFSPEDAEKVIRKLTTEAQFYLDDALIAVLVQDLALETGDVRPIELQVVGAQLQREDITTLDQYRALGEMPKQTLVQNFLAYTVADCGPPNEDLARIVLYLLTEEDTDKRLYRPLRKREEIEEALTGLGMEFNMAQLDLVLEILVGSGLVFEVPDEPDDRYQLVHDYLVDYVRLKHPPDVLRQLEELKAAKQAADEKAAFLLAEKNQLLQDRLRRARRNVAIVSGLAIAAVGLGGTAWSLRREAVINEENTRLELLSQTAETTLPSQGLTALLKGVQAARTLENLQSRNRARTDTTMFVTATLEELKREIVEGNRLEGHSGSFVYSVSYAPDGKTLASAGFDGTVKLWSIEGEELQTLEGHSAPVLSVSYAPDGNTLASASGDGTVKLWSIEGEELQTLEGHSDTVWSVSYAPDGETLASTSADGTVKLWSIEGEELQTLEGHSGWVWSVSYAPDGNTLASAGGNLHLPNGGDTRIILWNLDLEDLLTQACDWLTPYLTHNPTVSNEDRALCNIPPR